jgi:hypothetical protein
MLLIIATAPKVQAQEGDMGIFESSDENVDPGSDPDVPVDGGLSILVAAGGAYMMRKHKEKRTQNKNKDEKNKNRD